MYYADAGEIEVVVKKLQAEDIDKKFMEHHGISKICGARCRIDLEQFVGNIPAAVKGALDDIDEKYESLMLKYFIMLVCLQNIDDETFFPYLIGK